MRVGRRRFLSTVLWLSLLLAIGLIVFHHLVLFYAGSAFAFVLRISHAFDSAVTAGYGGLIIARTLWLACARSPRDAVECEMSQEGCLGKNECRECCGTMFSRASANDRPLCKADSGSTRAIGRRG